MVNYSDMLFTSALRYEYVVLKSDISFSIPSGGTVYTFTINHNLGYIPFFRLWYTYGGAVYQMFSGASSFNIDGNFCQVDSITATSSAISIEMENDASSGTATGNIYYRIYGESGT